MSGMSGYGPNLRLQKSLVILKSALTYLSMYPLISSETRTATFLVQFSPAGTPTFSGAKSKKSRHRVKWNSLKALKGL